MGMAVPGGAHGPPGGRSWLSRGAIVGGGTEKTTTTVEHERGNAKQGRKERSLRVHLPECHYQSSTSNQCPTSQHSCTTAAHCGGALLRTTSARTCGSGGRTGSGGPGGTGAAPM